MTVTSDHVAVELGVATPTDLQKSRWQSWIDQALYLIGKRLPIDSLDSADVDYVVLQSVALHAHNPENSTQVSVSIDDGQVSRSYRSGTGRVVIPDDLWGLLDPDMANESGVGSTLLSGAADVPGDHRPDCWVYQ